MPEVEEATCVCPACAGTFKLGADRCPYCGNLFVSALGPGTPEGDARRRIVDLSAQLAKKPNDAQARYELGKAWHQCGEFAKAQDQLNAALQLNPKMPEAFNLLAWNAALQYGWSNVEIEKQAGFALALKPNYPEAQALIHVSRGVSRQLFGGEDADDEALDQFRKAAQVDPKNAYAWYFAGLIYEKNEEYPEARRCLEQAASCSTQDLAPGQEHAKIFARLGIVCAELDDEPSAKKYLTDAVNLDPDNDAAKGLLAKLP